MVQASAKRPGILELTVRSWRSALGALVTMLPLFAIVTAALFALNYAFPIVETKLAVVRPGKTDLLTLMQMPAAWVFALEKLAIGLAAAPAALAAMRHVLIHDGWRLSPGPMLRFWGWAAAVLVVSLGALYLSYMTAVSPGLGLVGIVLKLIAAGLPLLTLLVFPAVAADEPATGLAQRLDRGLERWDGNFWRFVLVMAFTAGPGLLLTRLPAAVIMRRPGADADAVAKFDATIIGSALHSALTVVLIVLASVALAWCWSFSNLPKPVKQPLGTAPEATKV